MSYGEFSDRVLVTVEIGDCGFEPHQGHCVGTLRKTLLYSA